MCRWAAHIGAPIFLSELISAPEQSLIEQSRSAQKCKTAVNADGFGVAWYAHRAEPGLYRDVYPAWSDPNLKALADQVKSSLFLVHVRAATGTAISRNNCHPFACDNWSFMHNGQIGQFDRLRKSADMAIPDALYHARKGATDSEALFLIALGQGLDHAPKWAMQRAVRILHDIAVSQKVTPRLRMALAFSDGETLYTVRYATDAHPPSLYYRRNDAGNGWIVVSEPLQPQDDWRSVAPNSFSTFSKETVTHEVFDAFSDSLEKPKELDAFIDVECV